MPEHTPRGLCLIISTLLVFPRWDQSHPLHILLRMKLSESGLTVRKEAGGGSPSTWRKETRSIFKVLFTWRVEHFLSALVLV